jgi:Xaa-Pro aminopeptidase
MLGFLDKLRWYCRNRNLGCDVESVYSNVAAHLKNCQPLSYVDLLQK